VRGERRIVRGERHIVRGERAFYTCLHR
jgi:hypothetical protein